MITKLFLDRKSTRLNSSHTEIYTLSLHDALPICLHPFFGSRICTIMYLTPFPTAIVAWIGPHDHQALFRSEEHTSELQSHRDLHSFPTRRSSDLSASFFW